MKIELDSSDTFHCTECDSKLEWRIGRTKLFRETDLPNIVEVLGYKTIIRVDPCPKCQQLARELGKAEK